MSVSKVSNSRILEDGDLSKGGKEGGKEKDESSSGRPERSASPEIAKCAICLGDVVNRSYSNSCSHQFCFGCLLEWSKVKPECPLCKSSFRSIYHNFRSNNEFDEYVVPTPIPHLSIRFTASGANYRLSPFIRVLEARGHPHSPLAHAFEGVPIPSGIFQQPQPVVSTNPFNNSTGPVRPEFFGDLIGENRRAHEEAVQMPGYQNRRRHYDRNEWVQPFGSPLNHHGVRYPSVEYIRNHPSTVTRLRSWLHRELNVLLGLYISRDQMAFVYDLILHLINHYDVRSQDFRDMVNTYFGTKTQHFQHELYFFILSGMSMEEYDRVADYTPSRGARRSMIPQTPEVITLDSDEEGASNRNVRRPPPPPVPEDVILLDTSSDEDEIQTMADPRRRNLNFLSSNRRFPPISVSNNFSNPVNPISRASSGPPSLIMPHLSIASSNEERPTNRRNIFGRDPEMPILEPQIFDPAETFGSFSSTTIDRSRATAATTTVTNSSSMLSLIGSMDQNQNMTRPSVLSSSRGRISASNNEGGLGRLLEPDFDIDFNVSVESYSSPPREPSRPLRSPDFPVLQLRRSLAERESWERSGRGSARGSSSNGGCPFATYSESTNGPSTRGTDNTSAFVPYEPEPEPSRPPRPSCIRGSSTVSHHHHHHSSTSSRDFSPMSPTPSFRIDLYPRGISSSQVMDLSRSAGLISNASTSATALTRHDVEHDLLFADTPPPPLSAARPVIAGPSTSYASFSSKVEKKPRIEKSEEPSEDTDELECLGSFPIEKKPPLAVITLSSDDEEESRVKEENKRERLNILSSDDDTNLLDGFMTWSSQHLSSTDFMDMQMPSPSPPVTPVIDFQSSSSSGFNPITQSAQESSSSSSGTRANTSNGSSTVISIPNIPSFRLTIRNSTTQNSTETSGSSKQPIASTSTSSSNERHKKKHKHSSPKKSKSKRARAISSSSEESDNDEQLSKRVQSATLFSPIKVQIPKKRKYIEYEESPEDHRLSSSESSGKSEVSSDSENDDSDNQTYKSKSKSSSSSKKRSPSKKKHKAKSKKSKKSKKSNKDKSKRSRKSSSSRSGSKVKSGGSDTSSNVLASAVASTSSGGSASSSRHLHMKTRRGGSDASSSVKSTVQAPSTSSSASYSLSTPVMNMPVCDFEYPSGLLDLSFNSRTDEEDDMPLPLIAPEDDNTINLRLSPLPPPAVTEPAPQLSSTVDTSAIFSSPSRAIFNAFWDDYASSFSGTGRRNSNSNSWVD